ncbi:MAG TPA: CocE/NonD family hydrolase, partial [Pseudomonadales bacterium]|nr:CocE/NonD family hydrolase [Pseudomonadales bacterium]
MTIFSGVTASRLVKTVILSLMLGSALTACKGESTSSTPSNTNSSRSLSGENGAGAGGSGGSGSGEASAPAPRVFAQAYERAEEYPGMVSMPLQYITTSSGKKLAVKVTLPADKDGAAVAGPFPVIMVQTGYNLTMIGAAIPALPFNNMPDVFLAVPDPYIVQRGYAHVAVDVMGTGASEGGWEMIGAAEQAAYVDTLDWVLKQPWSDGNIGLAGASYMAITSLFTAAARPDAIKAIFANVPMGDAYRGVASTGGMLNALFLGSWIKITQNASATNGLTILKYPALTDQISSATQEHIDQIDNYYLPEYNKALAGEPRLTYDGDYWKLRSPVYKLDQVKAPTFITGANNCIFQRDEPMLYEILKANNVDTRLVMYDGDHISNFAAQSLSNNKVGPVPRMMLQWFDKYLKGMNSGIEKIPQVTQYVKGYSDDTSQSFSTASTWPHPKAAPERWYLHGDMTLTKQAPSGEEASHSMVVPEFEDIVVGKSKSGRYLEFSYTPKDGTRCSMSYRQWTL